MHESNRNCISISGFLLSLSMAALLISSCSAPVSDPYELKVSAAVMDLVSTWDEEIWFYTGRANPIQSLGGLNHTDIACGGMEFFEDVLALYTIIGIESGEVHVVMTGNPIFSGMENPPKLYINWSNQKPNLEGAVRVILVKE